MGFSGKRKTSYTAFLAVMFAAAAVFLIWRAPYGYSFDDESFIVSLALRLTKGDMLLTGEWHGTQNVAVLLLPFVKLFQLFHSDTTGLLLWLRYCYCVLWYICCGIMFFVFEKKSRLTAALIYVYLILFSPMALMTLSYTSLSLMSCLLLCCLIMYETEFGRMKPWLFSLLFALLSCAFVLSCIFVAAAYIVSDIVLVVLLIIKRNTESGKYYRRHFILTNLIIAAAAILYVYMLILRGTDIELILKSIPLILADPQHQMVNPLYIPVRDYLNFYRYIGKSFTLTISLVIAACALIKKLRKYRLYIFALCAAAYAYIQLLIARTAFNSEYLKNWHVAGIALIGLAAYFMLENKPKNIFRIFWGMGLIYSYFNAMGSNTGFIATCMTLSVCGVGSIYFIICLARELREQYAGKKLRLTASAAVILLVFTANYTFQLFTRLTYTYFDVPDMSKLCYVIDNGAAKGLRTSEGCYEMYNTRNAALKELLCDASAVTDIESCNFVSLEFAAVLYLDADLNFGTYSAWTWPTDVERLNAYYELRPDKTPDLVFFRGDEQLTQASGLAGFDNYTVFSSGEYGLAVKTD